jgi:cytochrome c-type biogenesis protein CcmH/NrfG
MTILMITAAILSGLSLNWVLHPLKNKRVFYTMNILCALAALGLYLAMGKPDLPATHVDKASMEERRDMMRLEFDLSVAVQKNPDDADALIRLAAVHMLQGRDASELLDQAEKIAPKDPRINTMRRMN